MALCTHQIEHQDYDTREAVLQVQYHREENQERYNDWNQLRDTPLEEGSLVLLHDTKQETSYTDKLVFWWLSPYQICEVRVECHSGWDGMGNGHATPNPQWDGSKYIYPIPIPKSRRDGGGISHNSQRTDHLPN